MFLGYAFDLLVAKNMKDLESRFCTLFRHIRAFLEKVLRFAGFEETKLHYEAKTTTD
jgi:hypothetical protein